MWHRAVGVMVVCWLGTACNQLLGIPDVAQGRHVTGRVRGLWDGADGVSLRLVADRVDTLLTVSMNGEFHFPPQFAPGASYTVTVATNPLQHTCVVDGGGNGVIVDADVASVSIACTGPAMTVGFSGPWGYAFDPTQDTQTFSGSVIAAEVALTIGGSGITGATVDDAGVTLGQPSAAIALPLGETTVRVGVSASGGLSRSYVLVFQRGASVVDQITYGKASNPGVNDSLGYSVSLSGNTLAVGAPGEASGTTDPLDNSASNAGAVYVFVRTGTTWTQQAYLKASNVQASDQFGCSVSLSGDTLAVGAYGEASGTTNPADNSASQAGAVYVFVRSGTTWTQQAYLKASNLGMGDQFGWSVALSGDTLAVGAPDEDSARPDPQDDTASNAGAVYVFTRGTNKVWTQQAYLKASNPRMGYLFGWSVALSGDTLAVGSVNESSAATGVDGDQTDHSATGAGGAYVFVRAGTAWAQQAFLKASNTGAGDSFGWSVALSGDLLAVSAIAEASATTGVNGNQTDNSAIGSGAVYLFLRTGTTWAGRAYLKASNTAMSDNFGFLVALSPDTLVVAAPFEAGGTTGFNGNQADNSAPHAGALYVFR